MNKDLAFGALNDLIALFDIESAKAMDSKKLSIIIKRNFIISYYTIWETYIRHSIYDLYEQNENLLYDEEFVKRYLEKVITGKGYISKKFLGNLNQANVQKEVLCDSNNLKWKEFEEFNTLIGFDINSLKNDISSNKDIIKVMNLLSEHGITPVYSQNNEPK